MFFTMKVMLLLRIALALTALVAVAQQNGPPTLPGGTVDLDAPILQQHASDFRSQSGMHDNLVQHLVGAAPYADRLGPKTDGLEFSINDDAPSAIPGAMLDIVQKAACAADAIMIGGIADLRSHLTTGGTGVYTDYAFNVQRTLKGTPAKQIVLLRIGGNVTGIASGTQLTSLKVTNDQYPALLPGTTYLIFLDRIAATGAYAAPDPDGTLVASNGQWLFARKAHSNMVLPQLAQGTLENNIANWMTSCQ